MVVHQYHSFYENIRSSLKNTFDSKIKSPDFCMNVVGSFLYKLKSQGLNIKDNITKGRFDGQRKGVTEFSLPQDIWGVYICWWVRGDARKTFQP